MPKPAEPDKIPITSPAQLRIEFDSLHGALALEETEHTWEKIDKAVKRFQAVVRGGAGKKELADEYVRGMRDKTLVNGLIRSLATERTRLSGSTLDLVASSTRLGPQFAPLLPLYLPTLLRLLCRTNKLYITRSTSTINNIVKNTRLVDVLRFIVGEWQGESGKSATFREKAAEITAYMLSSGAGGELILDKDVLDRRVEELEWIIKTAAVDKDVKVRAEAKKCWEVYKREWPERVASFTSPMTPTIRRYLNVTANGPSAATNSRAPPVKKPRVPSALSSSVSHAPSHPAPTAAPARPVPSLSRSVGASRPLAASSSHRAPLNSTGPPASSSGTLSRSTSSHSSGMAPPPARTARAESTRSASNPSSRPGSRNDDLRKDQDASAPSHSSMRAPVTASLTTTGSGQGSFRPTSSRSGASSAPPFKPAVRTAMKPTAPTTAPTGEPRRARRIAQDPAPVPAPPSAPAPAPALAPATSSSSTLSRSTSSSTVRAQTSSSSAHTRPHPPVTSSSTSAPFRPHKPTTARPPPAGASLGSSTARSTGTSAASSMARNGNDKLSGASAASGTTRARREKERVDQRQQEEAEARNRAEERKAAAAEIAALESAAKKAKEREKDQAERDAEERRSKELADKAREVPLPVEEDEMVEEDEVVEDDEEGADAGEHEEAFVVESQETVVGTVGMDSDFLIESQPREDLDDHEAEEPVGIEDEEESIEEDVRKPIDRPTDPDADVHGGSDDLKADAVDPTVEAANDSSEELEADQAEPEPESPVVEGIRLVGDLPPSPFLAEEGDSAPRRDHEEEEKEELPEDDEQNVSASTIAPSPSRLRVTASPLPDVSVALDTLALTTDVSEASMLADMTLPRSPAATPLPLTAAEVSSPMPAPASLANEDEECFSSSVDQTVLAALPPLSPEPCQTASIVLETPPRFDDPPAQLRLPGRPVIALNFPGRASVGVAAKPQVMVTEEEDDSDAIVDDGPTESEDDDSEGDFDAASPSRRASSIPRAVPPPTPLRSVPRQRQPVFFPESASYTDVETSFEEQDDTDEDEDEDEEELSARAGRSYEVPLNDAQDSGEYDDSDMGEVELEVAVPDVEEDQSTPKAQAKFEASSPVDERSASPVVNREEEPAEEEDEDESRFELERPELRFHDETESEPEVTMEEMTLSDREHVQGDDEEEAVAVEQPNVFKRSLRSRVVTVDLQHSTKTPSSSRSREILSELQ
ncbi:hypothetical protein JCM11491_007184 [Sporobolomyces phaffii]